jgi:hypothetical protein
MRLSEGAIPAREATTRATGRRPAAKRRQLTDTINDEQEAALKNVTPVLQQLGGLFLANCSVSNLSFEAFSGWLSHSAQFVNGK